MTDTSNNKIKTPTAPVDFVIITALEEERDAMLLKLANYKKLDKESEDIFTYYFAEVKSRRQDGSTFQVILAIPLNMGPINATSLTVSLIQKWKPKYVILTGIACGIKGEVDYGDIMIATQVADYSLGKQINGQRKIRWEVTPSGPSLLDSSNNIDSSWTSNITVTRPSQNEIKKVKGVIASGGDVISDDEVIKAYSESWPKLIGIEMESAGVAAGVNQTIERPEFLMVKSVSDFGKDKHDPSVVPWRKYACDAASAFTLEIIIGGPSQSVLLVKEKTEGLKSDETRKEAAERRWIYIQEHPLTELEIHVFLKSSVGRQWLIDLLQDIRISFNREHKGISLKDIFTVAHEPNKSEHNRKSDLPSFSFWQIYEEEEGYWCKRIDSKGVSLEIVAGFEVTIPWRNLNLPEISKLRDLALCEEVFISFPPKIFNSGIEEVIIGISGKSFSYSVYVSDDVPIDFYQEMATTFNGFGDKHKEPMHFSMGFHGGQLLDMFHQQTMPDYKRKNKKEGFMMGQSKGEKSIFFYPSMPKGFNKTKESQEYSITIPGIENPDYKKTEENFKNEIKNDPSNIENYVNLASLYSFQGRLQEAIKFITKEIKEADLNADLHGILSSAYANLGRFEDSIDELRKAEILEPNNAKIQFYMGQVMQEMDNHDSILHFEKAIHIDSNNDKYNAGLSRALGRENKIEQALIYARKAVELNNQNIEHLLLLTILLDLNSNLDEALVCLDNVIKLDPKSSDAFHKYANIFAKKGDIVKANDNYKQSIKLKKDIDCYADWGRFLCDTAKYKEADAVCSEGLKVDENHQGLLIYLGVSKANQGDYEAAILNLKKADSINPKDTTAANLIKQINDRISQTKRKKK